MNIICPKGNIRSEINIYAQTFYLSEEGGKGGWQGEGQICVHPLVDLNNEEQTSYF